MGHDLNDVGLPFVNIFLLDSARLPISAYSAVMIVLSFVLLVLMLGFRPFESRVDFLLDASVPLVPIFSAALALVLDTGLSSPDSTAMQGTLWAVFVLMLFLPLLHIVQLLRDMEGLKRSCLPHSLSKFPVRTDRRLTCYRLAPSAHAIRRALRRLNRRSAPFE
jgi:hypothetical protein